MTSADNKGFHIREPQPFDRAEWEVLWNDYLVFYESTLPQAHTEKLWERILDDGHPIRAYVTERAVDSRLIGIVHFFPHLDTWEIRPICYLQDLYVAEDARLKSVGTELIQKVKDHSDREGWVFVYLQTMEDNTTARYLYDKLTGGKTGSITYQLGLRSK
jgi:GNAT superfamily N-acetyltransferase